MHAHRDEAIEKLTLDLHVKSSQTTNLGAHSDKGPYHDHACGSNTSNDRPTPHRDVSKITRQIPLDAHYEHTRTMGCSRKRAEVPSLRPKPNGWKLNDPSSCGIPFTFIADEY